MFKPAKEYGGRKERIEKRYSSVIHRASRSLCGCLIVLPASRIKGYGTVIPTGRNRPLETGGEVGRSMRSAFGERGNGQPITVLGLRVYVLPVSRFHRP